MNSGDWVLVAGVNNVGSLGAFHKYEIADLGFCSWFFGRILEWRDPDSFISFITPLIHFPSGWSLRVKVCLNCHKFSSLF